MNDGFIWLDVSLAIGLLIVALYTLLTSDLFQAAVLFLVFGLLMAIGWCRLQAVDVAIAEAAIGAGLTGALLFNTLATTRTYAGSSSTKDDAGLQIFSFLGLGFVLFTVIGFTLMATAIMPVATSALPSGITIGDTQAESGVSNRVTAVLLNYRAYDTLLEVAVMLTAVWAAMPLRRLVVSVQPQPIGPMHGTFLRLILPTVVLVAAYILWTGSKTPGGAFQAAALLSAAGVLLIVSGVLPPSIARKRWRIVLVFGTMLFAIVAVEGLLVGRQFLQYRQGVAGASILLIETALTLSIATTLIFLFSYTSPKEIEDDAVDSFSPTDATALTEPTS